MKFKRLGYLALMSMFVLVGCEADKEPVKIASYEFNEGQGEQTKNTVSEEMLHVNYVFNEKNADYLSMLPSDPLWYDAGIKDGALLFDGYSSYIEDNSVTMPTDKLTISAWVAPRAYEWGDGGILSSFVSQGDENKQTGVNFGVYRHGTWSLQLGVGSEEEGEWLEIWDESAPLPTNEWSHVVATYNSKTAKATLYLNGEVINEEVFSDFKNKQIRLSEDVLTIGKSTNNIKIADLFDLNIYNGLMDEVAIYDGVLDSEEVKELYDSSLEGHQQVVPIIDSESVALNPEIYATDPYRPQYHAIPGGHWMNEPHAPIYYNGKYHLFYQHNPHGPFWHQIHWGHWVSDDLVSWENVEPAIAPTEGDVTPDGVWSGSAAYDENGIPVLFFTAGNDSKSPNQSVGLARPVDPTDPYLTEWEIHEEVIVVQEEGQGDFGEFRDPFVWREEDGTYFMLVTSGTSDGNGGTALVYSSDNIYEWEYHGHLFESNYEKYDFLGEHWELPVLLPVKSEDGSIEKDILLINPHGQGSDIEVYYWLGEFDAKTAEFVPEHEEPRLLDYGDGVFTGPSGFVDPTSDKSILFTIAQGKRTSEADYYAGWAHTAGMPIELYLSNNGDLRHRPVAQTENLREETLVDVSDVTVEEANKLLSDVKGDMLEIILEVENVNAKEYGINVRKHPKNQEYTSIFYLPEIQELGFNRANSSLEQKGLRANYAPVSITEEENVQFRILLDRSLIEVYCNDQVSITSRIFPTLKDSMGLELISDGEVVIKDLKVYQMKSIYLEETHEPYYKK